MEGTNGGTSFVDSSLRTKTITTLTGTTTSNTQVKFGQTSCFITGTDAGGLSLAANADFGFGTGDFTIEGWCYATNVTTRLNTLFDNRISSAVGIQVYIGGGAFTVPASSLGVSTNSAILKTGTGGVVANSWLHIAVTRTSNLIGGYVNGTQVFTVTDSRTYASSAACYVGRDQGGTSLQGFGGYLDDVRITKGVSRYTANFTPPTNPFPNQ